MGKKITLSNVKDFLDDILTGEIDNEYDAEKDYLKKIQSDENLL